MQIPLSELQALLESARGRSIALSAQPFLPAPTADAGPVQVPCANIGARRHTSQPLWQEQGLCRPALDLKVLLTAGCAALTSIAEHAAGGVPAAIRGVM